MQTETKTNGLHDGRGGTLPFEPPRVDAKLLGQANEKNATIHHSIIDTPESNRQITLESIKELIVSMPEHGQLVEIILYPHPSVPGRWMCADGNRRLAALRFLNMEARARLLDKAPTEADLIALRLTIDSTRKAMDRLEIGADTWRWMELTGATQDAAATALRFSTSYTSKLIAPFKRGIDPLIAMLREGKISGTAVALIAGLPPEKQALAVEEMKVILVREDKVKRDTAERICARLKGKKEKQPKAIKFICGHVSGVIKGAPLEALKAMHSKLTEALKRVERDPALVEVLPSLLR